MPGFLRSQMKRSTTATHAAFRLGQVALLKEVNDLSPRIRRLRTIDSKAPSRDYLSLTQQLSKAQTAVLTQLRTGHVPLQGYLGHFKLVESSSCPRCQHPVESVVHLLLSCPAYEAAHLSLLRALNLQTVSLPVLLNTPATLNSLFIFLSHTGRFPSLKNSQ